MALASRASWSVLSGFLAQQLWEKIVLILHKIKKKKRKTCFLTFSKKNKNLPVIHGVLSVSSHFLDQNEQNIEKQGEVYKTQNILRPFQKIVERLNCSPAFVDVGFLVLFESQRCPKQGWNERRHPSE